MLEDRFDVAIGARGDDEGAGGMATLLDQLRGAGQQRAIV